MIRVVLPAHLKNLAKVSGEVTLEVEGPVTQCSILDELETRYPVLLGTIRDASTKSRRKFVRFYACEEDVSHVAIDALVPDEVASGREPFYVIGAMAGG